MSSVDKLDGEINRLLTKIDIKERNGIDATKDMFDVLCKDLELNKNTPSPGLNTRGLIEFCDGIIELCKIATPERPFYTPIWHIACEAEKIIAAIDQNYNVWVNEIPEYTISDDISETELLKSFIKLFTDIKKDVIAVENKTETETILLKYRLKIYDHFSMFTLKQLLKDIEKQEEEIKS